MQSDISNRVSAAFGRRLTPPDSTKTGDTEALMQSIRGSTESTDVPLFCNFSQGARSEIRHRTVLEAFRANLNVNVYIWANEESFSYGDIATASHELAVNLLEQGVLPGEFVGIIVSPTSPTSIVALLAIFQLGAIAVISQENDCETDITLDCSNPERIRNFIDKHTLVSLKNPRYDLPSLSDQKIDPTSIALVDLRSGGDIPYQISHQMLARWCDSFACDLSVSPQDQVMQIGKVPQLIQLWVKLAAMYSGATWISDLDVDVASVTHILASPNAYAAFDHMMLEQLKTVAIVGDRCPTDVRNCTGSIDLLECYGPGTPLLFRKSDAADGCLLGQPAQNCSAYILDEALGPLPMGERGKVWVADESLNMAYELNPDLVQHDAVRIDPYGDTTEKMFMTTECGHWNADGNLVFCEKEKSDLVWLSPIPP